MQSLIILLSLYLLMTLDPGLTFCRIQILLGHNGVMSMLLFWSVHYRSFAGHAVKIFSNEGFGGFRFMVITVEKLWLVWGCF